jgi:hypothetical protein
MKKYRVPGFLLFCLCMLLMACNTTSPEQYFDRAVLNSNMLVGFGSEGELRQMESPSGTMDANGQPVPLKRVDELNTKIKFLEDAFKKLKALKQTNDSKNILKTSLALYQYVLPVYKTEYMQLAKLYDAGASKEKISSLAKDIHTRYHARYDELYAQLISYGKVYAERNQIQVNWNVGG